MISTANASENSHLSNNAPALVSVVIPLYNNADYVADAVTSILNQSYTNLEIIVVDDGSTDDSVARLRPFLNQILLIQQHNQGSAVARNKGIDAANGTYIAFNDADDLWTPFKLQVQIEFLESHHEYQLVCGIDQRVDHHFSLQQIQTNPSPEASLEASLSGWQYAHLFKASPFHINNLLIRSSALEGIRFDPSLRRGQDLDLWFQLCSRYPLAYLNEVLSYYRDNKKSISYKLQDDNYKLRILQQAVKRLKQDYPNHPPLSPFVINKAYAMACADYAYNHRLAAQATGAIKQYLQAIKYYPIHIPLYKSLLLSVLEYLNIKNSPKLKPDVH